MFEKRLKLVVEIGAACSWGLPGLCQTTVGRLKHNSSNVDTSVATLSWPRRRNVLIRCLSMAICKPPPGRGRIQEFGYVDGSVDTL